MITLLIALGSFILYIVAYNTYGKFLGKKIFQLDAKNEVPSITQRDGIDYVPTKKNIIFGHHFTSIAGTGPIVGPALAVIWGWLPALLWVIFGSILIGQSMTVSKWSLLELRSDRRRCRWKSSKIRDYELFFSILFMA